MGIEEVVNGTVKAQPEPEVTEAPQTEVVLEAIEPAAEPAPEAQEAPVEAKEVQHVPLSVMLDMRDGKKEAERRAADLERRLAEIEAAKTPQKAPDPLDDPEGHTAYLEGRLNQAIIAERFESSNEAAREKYGDEKVDAATNWALEKAKSDPTFAAQYMRERRPVDWIVRQHQRDGLLTQIGDSDLDTFVKNYVAQNGEKLGLSVPPAVAPVAVVPQQAPATPPRSLASQPSSGGGVKDVPTGPMASLAQLEAVINR